MVLVIPWSHVLYGSIVGPALGVALLWLIKERRALTLVVVAAAACAGTWVWNLMLNIRHAGVVDGDIPFKPFPISWQDVGTAVFTFAAVTLTLLATIHRNEPGRRTLTIAGIATLGVLIIDIYTW